MRFSTTFLLSLSLALATSVLADLDTESSPLFGLRTKPVKTSKRAVSSLLDLDRRETCRGTCQVCFGASYRECPDDDSLCYDPSNGAPSEACSNGGSTPSTPTTSSSASSTEIANICYQRGASCVACFGAGSRSCPAGSYYDCYDPDEHSEAEGCSTGGSSGSSASASAPSPSASGRTESCKAKYGVGNIPCGADGCYDPTAGETCCPDGSTFALPCSKSMTPSLTSQLFFRVLQSRYHMRAPRRRLQMRRRWLSQPQLWQRLLTYFLRHPQHRYPRPTKLKRTKSHQDLVITFTSRGDRRRGDHWHELGVWCRSSLDG